MGLSEAIVKIDHLVPTTCPECESNKTLVIEKNKRKRYEVRICKNCDRKFGIMEDGGEIWKRINARSAEN